jgi:hypothetical protein
LALLGYRLPLFIWIFFVLKALEQSEWESEIQTAEGTNFQEENSKW